MIDQVPGRSSAYKMVAPWQAVVASLVCIHDTSHIPLPALIVKYAPASPGSRPVPLLPCPPPPLPISHPLFLPSPPPPPNPGSPINLFLRFLTHLAPPPKQQPHPRPLSISNTDGSKKMCSRQTHKHLQPAPHHIQDEARVHHANPHCPLALPSTPRIALPGIPTNTPSIPSTSSTPAARSTVCALPPPP